MSVRQLYIKTHGAYNLKSQYPESDLSQFTSRCYTSCINNSSIYYSNQNIKKAAASVNTMEKQVKTTVKENRSNSNSEPNPKFNSYQRRLLKLKAKNSCLCV